MSTETMPELSELSDAKLNFMVSDEVFPDSPIAFAKFIAGVGMFTESLDAMAKAEETLSRPECYAFNAALMDLKPSREEMKHEAEKWSWHATAKQRAQAFVVAKGKADL